MVLNLDEDPVRLGEGHHRDPRVRLSKFEGILEDVRQRRQQAVAVSCNSQRLASAAA